MRRLAIILVLGLLAGCASNAQRGEWCILEARHELGYPDHVDEASLRAAFAAEGWTPAGVDDSSGAPAMLFTLKGPGGASYAGNYHYGSGGANASDAHDFTVVGLSGFAQGSRAELASLDLSAPLNATAARLRALGPVEMDAPWRASGPECRHGD